MLTCHSGLNGGIERQQVSLICDILNDTHNLADLVRAFAQALDFLRGLLDIFANDHHTINRLAHSLLTGTGIAQRILCCFGTHLGVASNILDEDGQRFYRLRRLRNLGHLRFRCLRQFGGPVQDTTCGVACTRPTTFASSSII